MRTKVTLVLLFLNVVLFFFIFHFERNWRTERVALEVRRRVLGAEAADIRSLDVASTLPGGSFSLERRGGAWFLTRPVEWRANPHAVSRIVNGLQFLEHETSFSVRDLEKNGQSLADYGLVHPTLTVTFTSGGPDTTGGPPVTTTLRIGSTTQFGQRLYLLSSDGTRIHVVGHALADSLSLPLEQLRDDAVLTVPVFEASSLNLQTAAPADLHIRIRSDGGHWSFETPILARASKNAIELAINRLDALRVKTFVTGSPPLPLPSAAPALTVTIEGNNRHETLFVGSPVPGSLPQGEDANREFYAQLEGRAALFTIAIPTAPQALLDTLLNAQEDLRDRHVLDFDARTVTGITLSAPNQPDLTLQRDAPDGAKGGGAGDEPHWQIVLRGDGAQGPSTLAADSAAVQRLLEQLSLLSAEKFQSDAPQASDLENWGFNQPERTVTLTLAGPPSALENPGAAAGSQLILQIGLPTTRDGLAYARVAGPPYVYAVGQDILAETPVAPLAWRERLLRVIPPGAKFVALKLTDLATSRVILDWKPGTVLGATAQPGAMQSLLDGLRTLRARRFTSAAFTDQVSIAGEERPWKYRLDATIALPGGGGAEPTSVTSLLLSERTGGTEQIAGSREFNADFALEQPLLDALWTLTYGARDPGPPPATP